MKLGIGDSVSRDGGRCEHPQARVVPVPGQELDRAWGWPKGDRRGSDDAEQDANERGRYPQGDDVDAIASQRHVRQHHHRQPHRRERCHQAGTQPVPRVSQGSDERQVGRGIKDDGNRDADGPIS